MSDEGVTTREGGTCGSAVRCSHTFQIETCVHRDWCKGHRDSSATTTFLDFHFAFFSSFPLFCVIPTAPVLLHNDPIHFQVGMFSC